MRRSDGVFSRRGATRFAKISLVSTRCRVAKVPRESLYRKVRAKLREREVEITLISGSISEITNSV